MRTCARALDCVCMYVSADVISEFLFIFNVIDSNFLATLYIMALHTKTGRRDSFWLLRSWTFLVCLCMFRLTFCVCGFRSLFVLHSVGFFWNVPQKCCGTFRLRTHTHTRDEWLFQTISKAKTTMNISTILNERPAMKMEIRNGIICLINDQSQSAQHACWPWIHLRDDINLDFSVYEGSIKAIFASNHFTSNTFFSSSLLVRKELRFFQKLHQSICLREK